MGEVHDEPAVEARSGEVAERLHVGDVEVDLAAFELRRAGQPVHVEPQVFEVLRYLVEHRDRLVTKTELLEQVWGTRFVSESALTSRIKALRRALGDDGREQRVIRTVHGRGYRFIAPVTFAAPTRGTVTAPSAPTAGLLERDEPLAVLDAALRDAERGQGRVVLVGGEAGIGKSALVRAFAAAHPGARVLLGACDDLLTPRPLGPFHDLALVVPRLAAVLELPSSGDLQRVLLEELRESRVAGQPPPALVVEDVHWADEATIDQLMLLIRRFAAVPAVLILTFRSTEVVGDHPAVPLLGSVPPTVARHITLAPLSARAVAELVGEERADEVMAATGGVPFFVTEVALDPAAPAGPLPASVAHAVRARVARLPADTAQLLDLLAVEPTRTNVALLDVLRPGWADAIAPAERAAVVEVGQRGVAFRHELARRAVLDALPGARRRELHGEVARALGARGADPARVVHHAEAAGDDPLVAEHGLVAAARASAAAAHREAWSHYQRVVPLLDHVAADRHGEVLELASHEAYAADDPAAALDLGTRALSWWRDDGDAVATGRVHRWLSRIHWYQARRLEAEVQAQLAVRVLEPLPPSEELAWAYSNLSQLAMLDWQNDESIRWGERAAALAQELGAHEVLVHARVNVETARAHQDLRQLDGLRAVVAEAKAAGLHHEAARGMISMSYELMSFDHPGDAAVIAEQGVQYAEQHEVETLRRYLVTMLGRIAVMEGRWDEAEAILRDAVARDWSVTLLLALASLALLQVRRGDPGVRATLDRGWPLAERAAEPQRILPFAEVEAELAWLQGTLPDVVPRLRDVYELARRGGQHGRLACALHEAGALDADPDVPEPFRAQLEGRWEDAARTWAERGMPYEQALALARTGPEGRAEAARIARRLGAAPLLARLEQLGGR